MTSHGMRREPKASSENCTVISADCIHRKASDYYKPGFESHLSKVYITAITIDTAFSSLSLKYCNTCRCDNGGSFPIGGAKIQRLVRLR